MDKTCCGYKTEAILAKFLPVQLISILSLAPFAFTQTKDAKDCANLRGAFIAMGGSTTLAPPSSGCCAKQSFWKCNNSRITEVNFNELGLKGSINPLVSELDQLVKVNFYGNQFNQFATTFHFAKVTKLQGLYVSTNQFTTFPLGLENLKALKELDFSDNYISDYVPSSITFLTSLTVFSASNNKLKGSVPAIKSSAFKQCNLSGNPLLCKTSKTPAICNFTGLKTC